MISSETLKKQKQTVFPIPKDPFVEAQDALVFLGSCFSDEISQKLHNHYFDTFSNPFGTLFTAHALSENLAFLTHEETPTLTQFEQQWHYLQGAAKFQHPQKEQLLAQLLKIKQHAISKIKSAQHLFITLGSTYYYEWNLTQSPVANCHKIPQKHFSKKRFTVFETIAQLNRISDNIKQLNPQATLIFTISPVRHLRDGIRENLLSKSILHVALDAFLNENPTFRYFPSFEIAQEELRDHQFFKEDLAHMNDWSTQYILYRFLETVGSSSCLQYFNNAASFVKAQKHEEYRKIPKDSHSELWEHTRNLLLASIS
jgi:hypothetical protein